MLIAISYPAIPCRAEFPPVWVNGSVGLDYQLSQNEDSADGDKLGKLMNLNVSTYLIQPWIAQVSGGFSYKLTSNKQENSSQDGAFVSGDARLRIFPVSKFPFELFYQRQDNEIDSSLLDTNTDLTRYGFTQRYTTPGHMNFDLRYEHNDLGQDNANSDTLEFIEFDSMQFDVSRAFGDISLDFTNLYTDLVEVNIDSRTRNLYSIIRHQYTPVSTLSVNGYQSFRKSKFDLSGAKREIQRLELNEYIFWRPQTSKPLLVTSALRYIDSEGTSGPSSNEQKSLTGTVGSSYQFSDRWQVSGSASLSLDDPGGDNNSSGNQQIEASYQSLERKFQRGEYNWFASAGLRAEQGGGTSGNQQSLRAGIGHGYDRRLFQDTVPIDFRFNQRLNAIEGSDDRSTQSLDNSLSFRWHKSDSSGISLAMLTLSDSRSLGGSGRIGDEERASQLVNLQISRQHSVNRMAYWSGNISLQVSRQDLAQTNDHEIEPNMSIDLNYSHGRLFGVNRLRFRSTLKLFSESYLVFIDDPDDPTDEEGQLWDNRLDYSLGLLEFRLQLRLARRGDLSNGVINLQVRRRFESAF